MKPLSFYPKDVTW